MTTSPNKNAAGRGKAMARGGKPQLVDEWEATRAQTALATQIQKNEDDYLDQAQHEIGRQIGASEWELFVSCAPAEALQQQFEHLHPEFIAVHDIAGKSSRKLLAGLAAAGGRPMQQLVIRRQGFGTPLATLGFIDLPTAAGGSLRMYTTDIDPEPAASKPLAHLLLAFARLAVVMIGHSPSHTVASALKPLHEAMLAGPWPNRSMLLLPLASVGDLATQGTELTRGTGVSVRTTPQVVRPADAWAFISGTWAKLCEQGQSEGRALPALGDVLATPQAAAGRAPAKAVPGRAVRPAASTADRPTDAGDTEPMALSMPMRPMPPTSPAASEPPKTLLERYAHRLGELPGVVSCCLFEVGSGDDIAHAGASPGAAALASHGSVLLTAMQSASRGLGLGHAVPEAAITMGAHHLLLRAVPRHPGVALHAVLDRAHGDVALTREQIHLLDAMFDAKHAA